MLAYRMTSADDIIRNLQLIPHPEGGHYRETFLDPHLIDGRPASSAIYYLLARGERSHWHRIDATEVWHWYAGAPIDIRIYKDTEQALYLGPDIRAGQKPQVIVPPLAWQCAVSTGDWSLVGCTVAPGFEFKAFELAPEDWSPPA